MTVMTLLAAVFFVLGAAVGVALVERRAPPLALLQLRHRHQALLDKVLRTTGRTQGDEAEAQAALGELILAYQRVITSQSAADEARRWAQREVDAGRERLERCYQERNLLAAAFCRLAGAYGLHAGVYPDPHAPGWPVISVTLADDEEVTWHVPEEMPALQSLLTIPRCWDGHSAEERDRRLYRFVAGSHLPPPPPPGLGAARGPVAGGGR